jgi:hypothetical protein
MVVTIFEKIFQSVGDLASLSIPWVKNIPVFIGPKSPAYCGHPVPQEGTLATSLTLGQDAVDAKASRAQARTYEAIAYG